MAIKQGFEDRYITQTELAQWFGMDRTTIRAYHSKGLLYRSGSRKTNEYHATASVNWISGHRVARGLGLRLSGAEPLALQRFLFSRAEREEWLPIVITLGERMGYSETACILAAGKIDGLVAAGKISADSPY